MHRANGVAGAMFSRALLILAVLLATAIAAAAERRVALVMGVDRYETLRPLDNAVNDARSIADTLEGLGFEVFSEADRDLRRTRRALEDFREDAAGADVALVFFAGHGVEIAGENRLLPADADASSLGALKESSLPLEEVRAALADVAPVGLVLLDACRNDPFGAEQAGGGRGAAALPQDVRDAARPGLGRVGRAENMLFAFAAAPGATASDGSAENSPFTSAAVRYLGTDGLEIRSALTLIQQAVYEETAGAQLPYVESGLPSLFFAAQQGALPERERLLMAMADITPAVRAEVETVAAAREMPLAPLYGALLSGGLTAMPADQRSVRLAEAAAAFVKVRDELRTLGSSDPAVTALRQEAERQLSLGAFAAARDRLAEAAGLDRSSRQVLKANLTERTLSEATTFYLSAGAAMSDLKYGLALGDYVAAVGLIDEVASADLPEEMEMRRLGALHMVTRLSRATGDLHRAMSNQRRLIGLVETWAAQVPVEDNLRSLASEHNTLGDIGSTLGDLATAEQAYLAARAVLIAAGGATPSESIQHSLGTVHDRLGNLYSARGDLNEAHRQYFSAYEIVHRLVAINGTALRWEALGVTFAKLGNVMMEQGDLGEARNMYANCLRIARALENANKGAPAARRMVAAALHFVGDLEDATGAFDAALEAHREGLAIAEELAAADPENMDRQRDLKMSIGNVGTSLRKRGEFGPAADYLGRAHAAARRHADRDPANTLWQEDLAGSDTDLGELAAGRGDAAGALRHFEAALAVMQRLSAAAPSNAGWRFETAAAQRRVGEANLALEDADAAAVAFEAGVEKMEPLIGLDPQNRVWKRELADLYRLAAPGRPDMRLSYLARARHMLEALKAEGRLPAGYEERLAQVQRDYEAVIASTGK
jgi:uncharacterized caspase-like protein